MTYQHDVLRVIDYIEAHLFETTVYEALFKEVFLSKYHFHRIFYAQTGYTLADYIRRRRFTVIAERLVARREKIIDIALTCGYTAHETFTRAFKAYFGVTPSAYRKAPIRNRLLAVAAPDMAQLTQVHCAPPTFETCDRQVLKGVRGSVSLDTMQVEPYWETVLSYLRENAVRPQTPYLYMVWPPETTCDSRKIDFDTAQAVFIGGVFDAPEGALDALVLPAQHYACFKLIGGREQLHALYAHIYFSWFKKAPYALEESAVIERYSADFSFENQTGTLEILVPIKPQ